MTATIMDGKALAARIREEVKAEVAELGSVGLATVLVGDDPASDVYIRAKHKASQEVGIGARDVRLPETASEAEVLETVAQLNTDDSVDGLLVQLPLPAGIDEAKVIRAVDPVKDVDGFHPVNAGQLYLGEPAHVGGTPLGIIALLEEYGVELQGAQAVVLGRSAIVGKPVAHLLLQRHATVTICHSRTRDLAVETLRADVLVAAVGVAGHRAARDGEGGRVRDRRRNHAHGGGSTRRRGPGSRGSGRAAHARAGGRRPDDSRDAPSQRRTRGAVSARGACVSGNMRLCFARSIGQRHRCVHPCRFMQGGTSVGAGHR